MCGEGVAGEEGEEGVCQIFKKFVHHTKEFGNGESRDF